MGARMCSSGRQPKEGACPERNWMTVTSFCSIPAYDSLWALSGVCGRVEQQLRVLFNEHRRFFPVVDKSRGRRAMDWEGCSLLNTRDDCLHFDGDFVGFEGA